MSVDFKIGDRVVTPNGEHGTVINISMDKHTKYLIKLDSGPQIIYYHANIKLVEEYKDTLSPDESKCLNNLIEAYNTYISLPVQHTNDQLEFSQSIHNLQRLLAIRVVRRLNPSMWMVINQ